MYIVEDPSSWPKGVLSRFEQFDRECQAILELLACCDFGLMQRADMRPFTDSAPPSILVNKPPWKSYRKDDLAGNTSTYERLWGIPLCGNDEEPDWVGFFHGSGRMLYLHSEIQAWDNNQDDYSPDLVFSTVQAHFYEQHPYATQADKPFCRITYTHSNSLNPVTKWFPRMCSMLFQLWQETAVRQGVLGVMNDRVAALKVPTAYELVDGEANNSFHYCSVACRTKQLTDDFEVRKNEIELPQGGIVVLPNVQGTVASVGEKTQEVWVGEDKIFSTGEEPFDNTIRDEHCNYCNVPLSEAIQVLI